MHKKTIREYGAANPRIGEALKLWQEAVEQADWANPADVRQTMGYTDQVGDERFIFNIKGNHYRLLAAIHFRSRMVYIKGIFTHPQYDKLTRNHLLTCEL